ncbi:thioredoxin reductase GliT [Moelleriella libera RCEF 2490]|uniref:Thioredoxin reductase GliT n=1 Tax=Moelleriella libera RCEF 2490 TaxID=1081109 RepID=A0A167YVB4_9HYPO|nr:thioredoxin reductase GliT [Moelleriella libera RCEF 2490]
MAQTLYDALIVGGGPAGLSMAAALARQVYSVLVLDSGEYRNARAAHMHTVPGFDHVPPAAYRAKIRDDLAARYPHVEGNVYRAKTLGLATGVRDVPPADVPGYDECWALGV